MWSLGREPLLDLLSQRASSRDCRALCALLADWVFRVTPAGRALFRLSCPALAQTRDKERCRRVEEIM